MIVATRWVVTHRFTPWQNEIAWMSLYFSVAVWASLMLGGFGLVRHLVPRYRVRRPLVKATRRPIPIPIRFVVANARPARGFQTNKSRLAAPRR